MLDLVIIGGSAAGSSASIYASRRKLNFKIITNDFGGEVAMSGEVNNWLGIEKIQGYELAQNFQKHVKSYSPDIDEGFVVQSITTQDNHHLVVAKNSQGEEKSYTTKTVIIATGIHPRKLGVPGEETFNRRGVTYCTVCDGPLYRGKTTATIGAGNSALESALMMGSIAEKVYLLTKYENNAENNGGFPRGENILIDKIKQTNNIEIIYCANAVEILGDTMVSGLKYKDTKNNEEKTIAVQGVMIHVGFTPNSDLVQNVEKDKGGQIIINQKCETNIPGIFAAGDVTNIPYKQIAVAVGQGVIASLSAIEYLNKMVANK